MSLIPREFWVSAPPKADGVRGRAEYSSGSKEIDGVSVNCEKDALFAGGERRADVDVGNEFCRVGVPTSGDVMGRVEDRRLDRKSLKEPTGSRVLGLRL